METWSLDDACNGQTAVDMYSFVPWKNDAREFRKVALDEYSSSLGRYSGQHVFRRLTLDALGTSWESDILYI
jgi:hypothetical protein